MNRYSLQHPLKTWRTTRKSPLTIAQLADLAGVDRTSLVKVENRDRDHLGWDSCRKLERAFPGELSADALMDWKWPGRLDSSPPTRRRAPSRRVRKGGAQ